MKIAVLGGAGAMGAVFGARLAKAGHQVTLIDANADAVAKIARDGLTIQNKAGDAETHRIAATTDARTAGAVDVVVNFVKCYHTPAAIASVVPILGDGGVVLSLQNGWGNAPVIASVVGDDRVFMGVTYHSATVLEPGKILHAGQGNTFLGPLRGDAKRADFLVQALNGAGLEATRSEDVRKDIWSKLALNICTLPTSALLRFGAGELIQHEGTKTLMRGLLREGVAVARAQGIALEEDERWKTITGVLERAGASKSSMYQDVENRRRTEIDVINGAIVAAGAAHGIATPLNEAMVCLVKSLEETFAKPAAA